MATWQLLNIEVAQKTWNEALLRLDDYTVFQTYAWGEYQRALGWEPCYWAAFDENGVIIAMMLGLLRRYPFGIGLIWSEGGPVGDLSVCDERLQKAIKQTTGFKRIYCRFRCDRQRQVEDALRLNAQGWRRSWFNLHDVLFPDDSIWRRKKANCWRAANETGAEICDAPRKAI